MSAYLTAALAVFRRDWALYTSYRMRFFSTLFSLLVSMTLFYYVSRLVHGSAVGDSDDYYGFVVVGLIIFGMLTSTLSLPIATLRSELLAGTFERMVLSPFGAERCIVSLLLFPIALAFVTATLSLVYAVAVFGLDVRWPEVLLGIPVGALAALSFAPFGLLMCAGVVLFKQTNAGAVFVVTGMSLLAGVYFPVTLLPDWIRWASEVQPFTPALDLLRHLIVGTPLRSGNAAGEVARLVGFAVLTMPLAVRVLGGAVQAARRRGTINEY
jgi:ABC-2 type transport system permease protein